MSRLDLLIALNPEYAEALRRGDSWAVKHAEVVKGLDGNANRRHPERTLKEDGETRRNWCGHCSAKKGCVMCDLDDNPDLPKARVGYWNVWDV